MVNEGNLHKQRCENGCRFRMGNVGMGVVCNRPVGDEKGRLIAEWDRYFMEKMGCASYERVE